MRRLRTCDQVAENSSGLVDARKKEQPMSQVTTELPCSKPGDHLILSSLAFLKPSTY